MLTAKQKEILTFITENTQKKGTAPTFRDIQKHFGFASLGTVYNYIQTLKKKKVLKEGKYTQVEPLEMGSATVELPIIGEVEQGVPPIIWSESALYTVPKSFVQSTLSSYIFLAKGNSLHSELIAHEDLLVVQAGVAIDEGDFVFALSEGKVYIRTYFKEDDYVRLESKTNAPPLFFAGDSLLIQGVITAVIRTL